jgi:hypothetical protein
MAYNGTTAGSTLSNPPVLIASGMAKRVLNNGSTIGGTGSGSGLQLWIYSCTDSSTVPLDANYFTDAKALGMQAGDIVIQVGATGSTFGVSVNVLGPVSTSGAAYRSTGSQITSTFS